MKGSTTPDGLFRGCALLKGFCKRFIGFYYKSSDAGWRTWQWLWVYEWLLLFAFEPLVSLFSFMLVKLHFKDAVRSK